MSKDPFFSCLRKKDLIKITMDSRMENIDKASEITKEFLTTKGLDEICFAACLVLREALTNAVRHANKYDTDKKIFYSVELQENLLHIIIEDQGQGFNWKEISEKEYDNTADHGRGFKIMKTYFNEVEFNEKGTIISLKKIL